MGGAGDSLAKAPGSENDGYILRWGRRVAADCTLHRVIHKSSPKLTPTIYLTTAGLTEAALIQIGKTWPPSPLPACVLKYTISLQASQLAPRRVTGLRPLRGGDAPVRRTTP
eukprot:scaffold103350_cov65-Phaeocystis_antarctica.AAC.4